ncbi:CPBP family intramembrane glutamic endopeptidase [Aestuariimicrobium kwangyangense]|uniref:CPBP family intramembrane glutamic endopeptidase n=1 Tax=Aestuariimicrobium kwangyangense TaxID=396389 RepID=UPI0003B34E94|nr:CPBP family intramembrane glutamic endopeptidase [Aestuariimicrobium kwangyangense]
MPEVTTHRTSRLGLGRGVSELRAFVEAALLDPVDEPPMQTGRQLLRRRIVVVVTIAVGAVALGLALDIAPGDVSFYPAALGVAALWMVGAVASGPLHLGRGRTRSGGGSRGVLQGFLLGLGLLVVFLLGAVVVGRIPVLRRPVDDLLAHAAHGSLPIVAAITFVNGVAEELFFRGAVYSSSPRRWAIPVSTLCYAASTLWSGVPLLTFGALCLGLLTSAQRRVTGGVAGPIAAHLTWSLGMLLLLGPALSLGD